MAMELCYVVSTSILNNILRRLATADARYRLVLGQDTVTLVHYGPSGVLSQTVFPIVYRIPDVPENEGTMVLMVATEKSREQSDFWMPLEKHLPGTSTSPTA